MKSLPFEHEVNNTDTRSLLTTTVKSREVLHDNHVRERGEVPI